jgi:L-lactate dehydrogenase (cytochrome)
MATESEPARRAGDAVSGDSGASRPGLMSAGGADARYLEIDDYRAAARRFLPHGLFDYIDRGTESEHALAELRRRLDAIALSPQVLTGHTRRDLTTTLLGRSFAMPIAIAPTALAGIVAHMGEVKLARAATRHGIPYCISTQSVNTVEEVRAGAPDATIWFQLYMWQDRALSWALLDRVRACAVDTLVVTVDTPVAPKRAYNIRNGFGVPLAMTPRVLLDLARHPRWLARVALPYLRTTGVPGFGHYPAELRGSPTRAAPASGAIGARVALDGSLSWADMAELRRRWPGKLVLKGVLCAADALRAADAGFDGIVVSSHGARNLDVAPAPAQVLPAIAEAVGARIDVLADSGVRRGSDALKYIALGAKAVLVGRAPLWGLAAGEEAGAHALLAMLRQELDLTMTFLGIASPAEARALIVRDGANAG